MTVFSFAVDGYHFGDRLLEGVYFNVTAEGDPDVKLTVTNVEVRPDAANYFDNLNTTKWLKKASDFAQDQLDSMIKDQCALECLTDLNSNLTLPY